MQQCSGNYKYEMHNIKPANLNFKINSAETNLSIAVGIFYQRGARKLAELMGEVCLHIFLLCFCFVGLF